MLIDVSKLYQNYVAVSIMDENTTIRVTTTNLEVEKKALAKQFINAAKELLDGLEDK